MSPEIIGGIAIVLLLIFLFSGIPIAYVLGFLGFLGYWAISGLQPALSTFGSTPFAKISMYSFTVIPLFIIMGHFAYYAGLPGALMKTARKWVGGFPGGLVQATIAGATALGAACGSGPASCAIVSKVTIPEMIENGVNRPLAYGAVAAAGTIAQMIPPSTLMVIYGVIAEQSVGRLLIAGIIPGIIIGLNYMIYVFIRCKINPEMSPPLVGVSWKERFVSLKDTWQVVILAVVVMGGIYVGVFTPTEAGAIGAFAAFIMAAYKLTFSGLKDSLLDTVRTTSMIFLIVGFAFVFGYVTSIARIPATVSEYLATLPPYMLLAGVMVMYIILGFFLDMIAAMYITLPIILPAIQAAGFDMIWFGVLMVHLCELALITPPFALNIYVVKGVIPNAEISEIIAGIWPFAAVDLVNLAIFIAFPQIALFLPNLMMKG